ncbi:PAS domain-containing sensor histidine kinase [Halobacillus halophilus]|uniref:histidine kinase n=1 Tax=Halobacillus halophilus (strain ATCC 35676 / DSM 2266 / JCM 20832 / KCTC 3685 / LMG 17431 / NBRC 102448 / NCIMB 2269) TaxID=866895 RepID=I0JPM9_HALH3|nr:ATP-binding protein [Halobacillus halophilus]ASF40130.1 PAS domain-containing sensor histidine kinase [Halobacillus halophilus]CCG46099.1 two-component sensor histidine kinase [Halobacillus halophilus DSM 2266]
MSSNTRPLITYTILVVIVMVGLGILLAQLTRTYFINIFEDRVAVESQYFSTYLERYAKDNDISQEELFNFSEQLNTGMVFESDNGEILVDTVEAIPIISENEKQRVLNSVDSNGSQEGQLIGDLFYYTTSIEVNNTEGTLTLLSPVKSLTNITKNIWLLIGVTLFLGLLVIFVIGFNVFSKYIRPIRSAANVATELAKGNYKARTYEGHFGEAGQLSRSINILARNLQEMTSTQGMQENQLEAVINNMGNGLVLIDEKGYILLVNRAFLETFKGEPGEYISYLYHDAIPYTAIHETVKKIYMFEETVSETFVLPVKIDRKHLEVTGAPIFSEDRKWKGVVLVFHDISELKQLEQMRKDFVANVSHELKTPITSIRGFSETLLDGAMKDEAMLEQFLHIILKESGRLQSLIQDLLELSKLEREDFNLNIEQVNIQRLLSDLLPIVQQHADQKEVHLTTEVEGNTMIEGDSSRLKQVFMNLLTNAINYTKVDGNVSLIFKDKDDRILVSVSDNGVGIPQEEVSRIFERFYRVDKARSRNSGGTGLGLAIVKHIVEAHHGNVHVDSVVDEGTTFHVEIPKQFTQS